MREWDAYLRYTYSDDYMKIVKKMNKYKGEGENKEQNRQEQIVSAYKMLFEKLEEYKNKKEYNYICEYIYNIIKYGIKNEITKIDEKTKKLLILLILIPSYLILPSAIWSDWTTPHL